ncbi:anti-sigma-D factor RsdA [Mycobacterium sp. ML4]
MRNSDFGNSRGDQPAFDEVAHTDLLLDALAARTEVALGDPDGFDDQALTALLGEWRDDLRWPPASALVSQDEAEDALRLGMMDRNGGRRGLAAVGSVAASLLLLSGFGAVVGDARPGDLLYGLHAMMFNEPRVSDDQIVLSAKADLAKVEQMIAQGKWDQAQTQLAEVSTTLQSVNDGGRRQGLLDEVNQLNTKVEKRDPYATPRPAAPPSELAVPEAPANSRTPQPSAPGTETPPPIAVDESTFPQQPGPAASNSPAPDQTTTLAPPAATTTSATPSTTTSRPKASTTTPSTSPTPSGTPTTTTPTPKSRSKPGTAVTPSATPNSPVAGPSSPASSTPPGGLWDRTSGPAAPRTPFPTGTRP